MSGCTGHCCESFTLSAPALEALTRPGNGAKDGAQVRDMVIEKSWHEDDSDIWVRCTCRHFDTQARRCTIYDQRPQMCQSHGVDYKCDHKGCTI